MDKTDSMETISKAEEVAQHSNKEMYFIEELLRENERLCYKYLHASQELVHVSEGNGSAVTDLQDELHRLRSTREALKNQFEEMKKENRKCQQRYTMQVKQSDSFKNLFVSNCQMHSSFDEECILVTIQDIVLHMVGAEVFSLWMVDPDSGSLEIMASTDECGQFKGRFPVPDDEMLRNLSAGKVSYFSYEGKDAQQISDPLACIPLLMEGRTIGAIVIYKLLVQKSGFSSFDHELLDLLAAQAVSALVGARCYAKSDCCPRFLDMDGSGGIENGLWQKQYSHR